jgi:mutator protein MutT
LPAPIRVAAGLVFDGGRLLITQRPAEKHLGGLWEFPGGKLDDGESYPDCLRRELREELGVEVAVGSMLAAIEHAYPEKTVRIQFYRCSLTSGVPSAIECADLEWITADQLDQFVFPPADTGLLGELKSLPELWE